MRRNYFQMRMKTLLSVGCMATALLLSSCYSSTVNMGDMKTTDPAVHVATAHDAHFIGGLVGSKKRIAKDYVGDNKNYRVKQYTSFFDGLLGMLTAGIYTPTTTKFYLPYGAGGIPAKKAHLPVKFGVRAGLNFATVALADDAENEVEGVSGTMGFSAGAVLDIPVSKSFYIQPGLYYSQKGFKYEGIAQYYSTETTTFTSTQGYVELPVLASYRLTLTNDLQLQVNAGPYFAVRLNNKVDKDDPYHRFDGGSSGSFDTGLQIGTGVTYNKHYYAGIGYEWGFFEQERTDSKNRNLFINIGYNF